MSEERKKLTREDIAKIEIGHTDVSPKVAWGLILALLVTVFAVPAIQHTWEIRQGLIGARPSPVPQCYEIFGKLDDPFAVAGESDKSFPWNIMRGNSVLLREINRYEDTLEEESLLQRWLLPSAQAALVRFGGAGNEQAYIGDDGWLFYRPSIDHLIGPGFLAPDRLAGRAAGGNEWQAAPQPDPRRAILQFRDQLAQRGIDLVIVPAPVKPGIHPDAFSSRYQGQRRAVRNPSFSRFIRQMRDANVHVFDPAEMLAAARDANGPQYLKTDTHWRPDAMERVARELAGWLIERRLVEGPGEMGYTRQAQKASNVGDIARMLNLPEGQTLFGPEEVTIHPVFNRAAEAWVPADDASVLLLGDSFSNIYSLEEMGWGFAAGFAEQLAFFLQRPVDRIVRNDDGAHATRTLLSRELRRGNDRLAGKTVVVWQFAARELSVGDWQLMDMQMGEPVESDFLAPEPGATKVVSGEIRQITRPARPPRTYNEAVTIYLNDLQDANDQPIPDKRLKVAVWGLLDNEWTPAARLPEGRRITVRLGTMDAAGKEGVRRKDVADFMLEQEPAWWGELVSDRSAGDDRPVADDPLWRVGVWVGLVAAGLIGVICIQLVRGTRQARRSGEGGPAPATNEPSPSENDV